MNYIGGYLTGRIPGVKLAFTHIIRSRIHALNTVLPPPRLNPGFRALKGVYVFLGHKDPTETTFGPLNNHLIRQSIYEKYELFGDLCLIGQEQVST